MAKNIYNIGKELFITNDEEIKEGGYVFWEGKIYKYRDFMKMRTPVYTDYFSIILTTDQDLIKDGVQAIDDEFLEWFVKNPSCEFVNIRPFKKFKGENEVEPIYKIIIPKEEPKQETLEEAAENGWFNTNSMSAEHKEGFEEGFIQGAKWQQERSYTEEDMRNAFDSAREFNSLDGVVDVHIVLPMGGDMSDLQPLHFTFEEWFEQFKKK